MHYYQFNIGDYQSHTGHLDPIEDIAYRRMLDWCYLHESALPNLPEQIARQIRMRGHEAVIQSVLSEFFILAEEGWYQTRIDEEIKHYHSKVEQASRAGKASAERRSSARSTSVQQTSSVGSTDEQPNKNQEPITKNQGEAASQPDPADKKMTLATYLANCKSAGKKPIPDDHYIREYAKDAGITDDMLQVNWEVFKDRYLREKKLYSDWPKTFANSVKSRWFELWYVGDDGMAWTTTGMQQKKVLESRMKGVKP